MEEKKEQMSGLPENAYRELKEGEEYQPMMRPDKTYREVTPWSVGWGLVMAVVFSAAAAFLGLKVGQVFEAAIPIAIIADGLSSGFKRKNALGENVINLSEPAVVLSWQEPFLRFRLFTFFKINIRKSRSTSSKYS